MLAPWPNGKSIGSRSRGLQVRALSGSFPFKSSVEDKRGVGSASSNLKLKDGVSSCPFHPPLVFALRFDITASRYAPICCTVGNDVPGYFAVSLRPVSGSISSHCCFSHALVLRCSSLPLASVFVLLQCLLAVGGA
jgi:hypothetical protein